MPSASSDRHADFATLRGVLGLQIVFRNLISGGLVRAPSPAPNIRHSLTRNQTSDRTRPSTDKKGGPAMRRMSRFLLAFLLVTGASSLIAQENFTQGPVSRVILLRITPGKTTDFWADVRQNTKPVFEDYKKAGIIMNYTFFTKSTTENADDWNVGYILTYQNYAAMDGLADRTDPITLKHYGTREARTAAADRRTENAKF